MTILLSWDVGIKNLSFCLMQAIGEKYKILDWMIVPLCKDDAKCKKLSLEDITTSLLTTLDSLSFHAKGVDYVLIENQPCMKNPMMKNIQIMIYTYFTYMNIRCKDRKAIIQFVSASNKLKVLPNFEFPEKVEKTASKYQQKKKKAILLCERLLSDSNVISSYEHIQNFSSSKKKDDLADAFLYAIWFLDNKSKS